MRGGVSVMDRTGEGISASLQERIRAFTSFYEQHAYLAYNLALRTACDQDAAMRAAGRGFLSQLDERPAGLVPAVVNTAINEAPRKPGPAGAGDAEAQRLLAAMAELAPPERAALALADLADADPAAIGEALRLDASKAAKLLHRGREAFAARLGLPRPQADAAARDWMWAAPPNEIWEELYPRFHRTAERQLHQGRTHHTLGLGIAPAAPPAAPAEADTGPASAKSQPHDAGAAPTPTGASARHADASARHAGASAREAGSLTPSSPPAGSGAIVASGGRAALRRLRSLRRSGPKRWRWSRRTRWEIVLPAAALLLLGGAAAARLADGGSSAPAGGAAGGGAPIGIEAGGPGAAGASGDDGGAAPVKPHKPLTPAELDKLRLRELSQLRDYTKRQADRRLPAGDRSAAARGIQSLRRAAERRLRAQQRREDRLREQLARERARSNAPPPPPPPSSRTRSPSPRTPSPRRTAPSATPETQAPSRETCLLHEETGEYYCPQ